MENTITQTGALYAMQHEATLKGRRNRNQYVIAEKIPMCVLPLKFLFARRNSSRTTSKTAC